MIGISVLNYNENLVEGANLRLPYQIKMKRPIEKSLSN